MSKVVRRTLQLELSRAFEANNHKKENIKHLSTKIERLNESVNKTADAIEELQNALEKLPEPQTLTFQYTNHEGKESDRTIIPERLYVGTSSYYKEDQPLLQGWCIERDDYRIFAVNNITKIKYIDSDLWMEKDILKNMEQIMKGWEY